MPIPRERGGVQLDRTLDSVGIDPGELSGFLQGEVLAGLPLDLAGALAQTPVHLGFAEYHRIDRRVLRGGVGEGLHAVGASIEAHVGRRVVHIVGVGRGVHVVGPHLFRLQRQARVRIHEEGVVGPVLAELLVVELVRDNVVEPAQKHGDVTHGTNGQPDVGLGRLFGIVGVDDNGLYAALSHFGVGASGIGCAGSARLGAPQHHALHGRAARRSTSRGRCCPRGGCWSHRASTGPRSRRADSTGSHRRKCTPERQWHLG